jgi:hypothetical protein
MPHLVLDTLWWRRILYLHLIVSADVGWLIYVLLSVLTQDLLRLSASDTAGRPAEILQSLVRQNTLFRSESICCCRMPYIIVRESYIQSSCAVDGLPLNEIRNPPCAHVIGNIFHFLFVLLVCFYAIVFYTFVKDEFRTKYLTLPFGFAQRVLANGLKGLKSGHIYGGVWVCVSMCECVCMDNKIYSQRCALLRRAVAAQLRVLELPFLKVRYDFLATLGCAFR